MKKIISVLVCLICLGACMTLPTSSENAARGDGYFKDGQPQKAIAAYNKALEINPKNIDARASRGAVYFFTGEFDLAQQDFEQVLRENPNHAATYTAYGSVLAARGDYQNALKVLNMAIVLDPERVENFFSRAGVYFMLGQYEEAITDYTSVINLRPAADVLNARGATYLRMGKEELANKDFELAKSGKLPATLSVYSMIK